MGYDQQPLLLQAKYTDWGMRAILKAADTSKVVSKVDSKDKEEEPPPPSPGKLVAPILKAASGNKFLPLGLGRVGAFFSGVHQ